MPRRLPVRPAKVFGNFFVLLVLSVIALIYYTFVFVVWGPRMHGKSTKHLQSYRFRSINRTNDISSILFIRFSTFFEYHSHFYFLSF